MRSLYGRASEELYNEKLSKLHNMLKYIDASEKPIDAIDGALWIENGILKVCKNKDFVPLSTALFQSMESVVATSRPLSPQPGQFWIDEGVLLYYDGINWLPVKADMFENYRMDNYEPFIVIQSLEAAINHVIVEKPPYVEENFVAKEGMQEVVLAKETYVPNTNSVVVYTNGRMLPKSCFTEPAGNLICLTHPAEQDEYITIHYIPAGRESIDVPLKFHSCKAEEYFAIEAATDTLTLSKDMLIGPFCVEVYLNGRYVPDKLYRVTTERTITFSETILPGEELLVYYIDKALYESSPETTKLVAQEISPYTQFIWPDSKLDKLFINGHFYMDYTLVNDITIQYPTAHVQGKTLSAVHVHPRHLYNVQKKLYRINKDTRFIQVDEYYSEIYAIKEGDTALLVKSQKSDTDYVSCPGGIVLSNRIAGTYDYILSVQYEFSSFTGRGKLVKKQFMIMDDSQIDIGVIHDPLLVFAQGHYLIPENNYEYDQSSGIIRLFFDELLDIGVITFPHCESGKFMNVGGDQVGLITLNTIFHKPLVFVYGEHLQAKVDVTITGNVISVPNVLIGMSYMVVDCIDDEGFNMFEKEGTLKFDDVKCLYYIDTETDYAFIEPIVFIEGLLVSKNDLNYFPDLKRLYVLNGGSTTQRYTLLKDEKSRYIHSDYRQNRTFSLNTYSNASMLYSEGKLLGDIEAFGVTELPKIALENEIKAIISYNKEYVIEGWYCYENKAWKPLPSDMNALLTQTLAHYILEGRMIHFVAAEGLDSKMCNAFLYQYDYNVEHGLQYGYYTAQENVLRYQTYPRHHFNKGQNALSVYMDGFRQYPATFNFEKGVVEDSLNYFIMPDVFPGGRIEYIVEAPELDEKESCDMEIVYSTSVVDQVVTTRNLLIPGFVTVYIDGVRQPKSNVIVIDDFHLRIKNFHNDERFVNIILIECRRDMYLSEIEYQLTYDHQIYFPCDDIVLPHKLLFTNDFLKIYYNGLFIGNRYRLDSSQKALIILDDFFENTCRKGDILTIEWR